MYFILIFYEDYSTKLELITNNYQFPTFQILKIAIYKKRSNEIAYFLRKCVQYN